MTSAADATRSNPRVRPSRPHATPSTRKIFTPPISAIDTPEASTINGSVRWYETNLKKIPERKRTAAAVAPWIPWRTPICVSVRPIASP